MVLQSSGALGIFAERLPCANEWFVRASLGAHTAAAHSFSQPNCLICACSHQVNNIYTAQYSKTYCIAPYVLNMQDPPHSLNFYGRHKGEGEPRDFDSHKRTASTTKSAQSGLQAKAGVVRPGALGAPASSEAGGAGGRSSSAQSVPPRSCTDRGGGRANTLKRFVLKLVDTVGVADLIVAKVGFVFFVARSFARPIMIAPISLYAHAYVCTPAVLLLGESESAAPAL